MSDPIKLPPGGEKLILLAALEKEFRAEFKRWGGPKMISVMEARGYSGEIKGRLKSLKWAHGVIKNLLDEELKK